MSNFIVIKGKFLIIFLIILVFLVSFFFIPNDVFSSSSVSKYTIVIDAGHGGDDGGAVGTKTNVKESELNLKYSKALYKFFKSLNFNVVLTRSNNESLGETKIEDMEKRKEIILKNNADLVISVHMNKFGLTTSKGAQVFYNPVLNESKRLAESIKNQLCLNIENARQLALVGDYYILNCCSCACVLIECGFLSNPEEEILLQSKSYIQKLSYQIFCGALKFINGN